MVDAFHLPGKLYIYIFFLRVQMKSLEFSFEFQYNQIFSSIRFLIWRRRIERDAFWKAICYYLLSGLMICFHPTAELSLADAF